MRDGARMRVDFGWYGIKADSAPGIRRAGGRSVGRKHLGACGLPNQNKNGSPFWRRGDGDGDGDVDGAR